LHAYLPALPSHNTVKPAISTCLKIAAEHAGEGSGAVEEANAFSTLFFGVPASHEVLYIS